MGEQRATRHEHPGEGDGRCQPLGHAAWEDSRLPPCVICGPRGRGPSRPRFLTHGVYAWLCAVHGSDDFAQRAGGSEFVRCLQRSWTAAGAFGARRRAALATHLHRLRQAIVDRQKPGSHTWPRLRREAERRFAAGEPPRLVIAELRGAHQGEPALVPSVRTMRRWFAQGRWLLPSALARSVTARALPPGTLHPVVSDERSPTPRGHRLLE
jgi:hypothetical protein